MSVEIMTLQAEDAHLLNQVAEGVFDNPINPKSLRTFLNDPRHYIVIALEDLCECEPRVIGMATAVIYIHPDKNDEMWINEVGVTKRYRRRGIASQLLEALLANAKAQGCEEAWVATDIDNKAARCLYRKAKGVEEQVVMYSFNL